MFDFLKKGHGSSAHPSARPSRHSRGWVEVRNYLDKTSSLRVLDFGTTSPSNINYLTSRGHSVYMANIVQDATRPEWIKPPADSPDADPVFDTEGFGIRRTFCHPSSCPHSSTACAMSCVPTA